jgi:hypothetical protein
MLASLPNEISLPPGSTMEAQSNQSHEKAPQESCFGWVSGGYRRLTTITGQRWMLFAITLVLATGLGVLLLHYFREYPKIIHDAFALSPEWVREVARLGTTLAITIGLFRLFSPKYAHLKYFWVYPPSWVAWLFALPVIAVIDLTGSFGKYGYKASWLEWVLYPSASIFFVCVYNWIKGIEKRAKEAEQKKIEDEMWQNLVSSGKSLEDVIDPRSIEKLSDDWGKFQEWLKDDSPAEEECT